MIYKPSHFAHMLFKETERATFPQAERAVVSLISFLKKRRQLEMLSRILAEFRMLLLKRNASLDINVVSAAPLSEGLKKLIRSTVGAPKEASIRERINPAMLGGVVVRYNDTILDVSVGRKLKRLEAELTK